MAVVWQVLIGVALVTVIFGMLIYWFKTKDK